MALPITIPYTFANATTSIPLSNLDSDFATVVNTINGIGNGTVGLTTITSPAATPLTIQSAGTTAMTIDTSQRVGIGTTSPVAGTSLTTSGIIAAAYVPSNGYTQLLAGGTTNSGYMSFIMPDGTRGGYVGYVDTANSTGLSLENDRVGPLRFLTNSAEAMRIDASQNILIGTTSVNYAGNGTTLSQNAGTTKWLLGPLSAAPGNFYVTAVAGSGVYLAGTAATSWTSNSDERLKNIIEPIGNATEKIGVLRAVIGTYKNDAEQTRRPFLIAQDIQKVLPEAVDASNPDMLGVQYTEVIPLLVAAIQELSAKNDALTARIAALEAK